MSDNGDNTDRTAQVVTFRLAGESYGVHISWVQEVLHTPSIRQVPHAPTFVAGVIDVRGRVIPVVDLRGRLGFEPDEGGHRRIMIFDLEGTRIGVTVDAVSQVLRVALEDFEPLPTAVIESRQRHCLRGVVRPDAGDIVILLAPERLLSKGESQAVADLVDHQPFEAHLAR